MSSPYPPQPPPRKFERSRSNKVLGGVCAGLATYLNMDVNLVRVLTVVVSLFTGFPVVLYIVALFLVPEEQPAPHEGPGSVHVPNSATGPAPGPSDKVWGSSGAPWDQTSSPANPPSGPSPEPGPSPAPDPGPSPDSPATAAPEGSGVADPEPVAETSTPEPSAEETSSWESAPAEPEQGSPESSGETPPSTSGQEGDKPA